MIGTQNSPIARPPRPGLAHSGRSSRCDTDCTPRSAVRNTLATTVISSASSP